ncbi:MAG: hypothetical protein L0H93_20595 [Nocardioides sp.]|nr:hypothetical protein [Nocardioides sp.]
MKRSTTQNRRKHSVKLLASAALVLGAAGVAGLGTYGSFTSSTSASTAVGTGTVQLDMSGQATRGLDVAVTKMVPGDIAQRAVQLTRSSTSDAFGAITLTSTTTNDNLLKSGTNGLKLQVDACDTAWIKQANNQLSCSGTTTPVLATGSVTQANASLPKALETLNGSTSVANLRIQLSLPEAADNTYQGLENTVKFDFTATQRAGKAV